MAYDYDENYISFLTQDKIGYILSLTTFEVKYHQNLTTLNPFTFSNFSNNSDKNLEYKSYLKFPYGIFSFNSLFFVFDSKESHMNSFIDNSIENINFLDNQKLMIFHYNNEVNLTTVNSLFSSNTSIIPSNGNDINIKDFFIECPLVVVSYNNGSENSSKEYYVLHVISKKIKKIEQDPEFLHKFIEETIENSFSSCIDEPSLNMYIDFEIDLNYFLVSCNDQVFFFSFASAYNQSFEVNRIYYKNPLERLFMAEPHIKIIEKTHNQLFYSIFSADCACYYVYEPSRESYKYFSNKRVLCMKNSVTNSKIEGVHYNKPNSYITLIMRNTLDSTIFFPSFHRCVLNMHTNNFICQICNTFYCPKQCERYQYPGCNFVGEVQRTFFGVLTMMILMSIIFLCCAHFCKNRESLCAFFCGLIKCFYLLIEKIVVFIKNIVWNKKCFRRLKYAKSYVAYWCKCGWKKLEEEQTCPICLENINNRPKMFFACGRHEVHVDCFNHYIDNNLENNKKEGCPFRDA